MKVHRFSILPLLALLATAAAALPPSWKPIGPFGGNVGSLVADPVRPGVLYALTDQGLYKTADAGASWSLSYVGDTFLSSLAVDPFRPSILYFAPGVATAPPLLKSTDGGIHWTPAAAGLPILYLPEVAADPARSRRLYVSGLGGIWRSDDAGRSWTPASGNLPDPARTRIREIAPSPHRTGTLLAATADGVYRSDDAGASWKRAGNGLPAGPASAVAFAPSDPRTVYAFLDRSGFFRSLDGGASWRPGGATPLDGDGVRALAVSARSPRTLYLLPFGSPPLRSTDGGAHWTPLSGAILVESLVADPFAAATVYACRFTGPNLGGVWRSDDRGDTWVQRSQGLTAISTSSLAIEFQHPERFWISRPQANVLRSVNRGGRWVRVPTPPGEAFVARVVTGVSSRVFAQTTRYSPGRFPIPLASLWKTDDGRSWTEILGSPDHNVALFQIAPSNFTTLYAVDVENLPSNYPVRGIYRSTDAGDHWELRSSAPLLDCGPGPGDLAVSPADVNTLYLSGCKSPHGSTVLRSDDGGATWTDVSAGLPGGYVGTLAADPTEPRIIYAGVGDRTGFQPGDGVWISVNGGVTWTPASPVLAGRTITALFGSQVAGRFYAATLDGHIFRTDPDGIEWLDWTDGLPPSYVFSFVQTPYNPSQVYAVTSRGLWRIDETD
jgi:photosystem II stability/assembly factor-like uncharacterized protein